MPGKMSDPSNVCVHNFKADNILMFLRFSPKSVLDLCLAIWLSLCHTESSERLSSKPGKHEVAHCKLSSAGAHLACSLKAERGRGAEPEIQAPLCVIRGLE